MATLTVDRNEEQATSEHAGWVLPCGAAAGLESMEECNGDLDLWDIAVAICMAPFAAGQRPAEDEIPW